MTKKGTVGKDGKQTGSGTGSARTEAAARRTLDEKSGGALGRIADYFTDAEENGMLDLVKKVEETEDDVRRDQRFVTRMFFADRVQTELEAQQKALRAGKDNVEMAFHAGQVAALSWIVEGM